MVDVASADVDKIIILTSDRQKEEGQQTTLVTSPSKKDQPSASSI